jgi:hypothetical protein
LLSKLRTNYPALAFVAVLVTAVLASVLLSQIAVPATGETEDYLVNPSDCPSAGWQWSFDVAFEGGQHLTTSNAVTCTGSGATGATGTTGSQGNQHSQVFHSSLVPGTATTVTISLSLGESGASPASPTKEIVMQLPLGMVRNYTQFPTCNESTLAAKGPKGCPSGSRIGTGTAQFDASPVVDQPINAKLTAFNGENGKVLIFVFPDLGPTFVIVGTPSDTTNGPVLTFAVPPVKTLPSVDDARLTRFTLVLGGKTTTGGNGQGYGYGYGYNGHAAATLELKPKSATNPVDTQHCVIATVRDIVDSPVENVRVRFTVTGSVTTTGVDTTDASGEATFCYQGPSLPGSDAITAVAEA